MLVYDAMQGHKLASGKLYSDVYRPVLVWSKLIDANTVLLTNINNTVLYSNWIEFNAERGYDVYYVD